MGPLFFDIVSQMWAKSEPARGLVNQRLRRICRRVREKGGPKRGQKNETSFCLTFFL